MVDFQERDTRRGLASPDDEEDDAADGEDAEEDDVADGEDAEEVGSEEAGTGADDAGEVSDEGSGRAADPASDASDEVAIDVVREALEVRPDEREDGRPETDLGDEATADRPPEVTLEPASDGAGGEPDAAGADDPDEGAGDGERRGRAGDDDAPGDHGSDHDHDHDHHHHDVETLGVAVVTVSSSRTMDDDPSGDFAVSAMVDAGHDVVTRELIADDYDGVQHTVDTLVRRSDVDVVVTTGGTGVTPDDQTIEAVRPLFEKELPGFGELFRRLSIEEIGSRVVGTRATAGVADGVPVFCLPGSTAAVELGVEEIITDVAPHLAGLAARGREETHHDHEHGRPVE